MAVNRKDRKPAPSKPPRRSGESMVDEVYHQILLRIVRGQFAGGAELKTTLLARELGTSRTPVIQALQRLAADGIVTHEVNRRAVVRQGAENWLVEIHQLREMLEPHAAALAARQFPDDVVARLRTLADSARPQRGSSWIAAAREFDYALHLAIAEHCGNLPLAEAIRRCWSFKRVSYEAADEDPKLLAKGYEQHLVMLDALAAHDPQTASAAALFHLRSAASLRPAETIV